MTNIISKTSNTSKTVAKSHKLVTQRIHKTIKMIVTEAEEPGSESTLKFENLGSILHRLGVFQGIGFKQDKDKLNQSTLTINQSSAKPERLTSEVNLLRYMASLNLIIRFFSMKTFGKFSACHSLERTIYHLISHLIS